jgi:hypothetical protein
MTVGALDETGQEKQGSATAGMKRQNMGCAGRVPERDQHRAPVLMSGRRPATHWPEHASRFRLRTSATR